MRKFFILAKILLLTACTNDEVIAIYQEHSPVTEVVDTITSTIETPDTIEVPEERFPITFNVIVEDPIEIIDTINANH